MNNTMNITIRKLTPDLADDYVHFFDVTPHDANIDEQKCYCVTWRSDASYAGDGNHWFPTREERRSHAWEFVKEGAIQGYLAYRGEEIVGWCNANGNCHACVNYLRDYWPIGEQQEKVKVKSVFCFAIAPDVQRMGVATMLLKQVCQDAAEEGYDFVEAYAYQDFGEVPNDFRGPLSMYEKCDFSQWGEKDGKVVMRKSLKE